MSVTVFGILGARSIYGNCLFCEVPRKDNDPVFEIGHFCKKVHASTWIQFGEEMNKDRDQFLQKR